MRLLGLLVAAVLAAFVGGVGVASATPTTATTLPSTTSTSSPGAINPSAGTGLLDNILNALSGNGGSGSGASDAQTSQMIVVNSAKASDTTATLTAFERGADQKWKPVPGLGPTKAFVGSVGIGAPADNVWRTPEGTFGFDQAFGRLANPGTKMPYFQATAQDWWDENPKSPTYNTHVHQVTSPGGDSENLYNSGPVYDYAVNIAHNPQRIPGKASGIFLHVTNGEPTAGCVAIDRTIMKNILVWLDPAKHPKITIGVNAAAPASGVPSTSTTPSVPPMIPTTPEAIGTTVGNALSQINITELLSQLANLLPTLMGAK